MSPDAATATGGVLLGSSAGVRSASTSDLIDDLREGLPISTFEALRSEMGLSVQALARATNIALRTLNRRRQSGRLLTDESERVYRVAVLFDRAIEVLGSREQARSWFVAPIHALGGRTPLEFADTEPGAREVEALLGRLEYGVFS